MFIEAGNLYHHQTRSKDVVYLLVREITDDVAVYQYMYLVQDMSVSFGIMFKIPTNTLESAIMARTSDLTPVTDQRVITLMKMALL